MFKGKLSSLLDPKGKQFTSLVFFPLCLFRLFWKFNLVLTQNHRQQGLWQSLLVVLLVFVEVCVFYI